MYEHSESQPDRIAPQLAAVDHIREDVSFAIAYPDVVKHLTMIPTKLEQ